MAESIAEEKAKLDSVLSCIEDIQELKQKQTSLGEYTAAIVLNGNGGFVLLVYLFSQ